ncbi:cyclic di-GMP phosphodiesterase [Pantoea sp. 1.19]|uniref:cyclic di-GMP phosphodiesterase n=1 Tax=Pantoea sp. 1.19 TaxID=1925589 RepID=UPI000948D5C2|nr:cyclic di-GMP phosphodiesterase [Pantoea sp. 1.19]
MPLAHIFAKTVVHPRRRLWLSLGAGSLFMILFLLIATLFTWQKRQHSNEALAANTRHYLEGILNDVMLLVQPMQSWTAGDCASVLPQLTERGALAPNVRAILLVRDEKAFCSSATGHFQLDIAAIAPGLNWQLPRDMSLIPGTPLLPQRPALVLWSRHPSVPGQGVLTTLNINLQPWLLLVSQQHEVTGIALSTPYSAMGTWQNGIMPLAALPDNALYHTAIRGYPLTLWLYGEHLTTRDLLLLLLGGVLLFVLVTLSTWLLLSQRLRPGREILMGIKRDEFHVEYQPVIDARSGQLIGVEALMRWTHPEQGRIPADAFIAFAEGQRLIAPLTRHLFRLIARDAPLLSQHLPPGCKLGVNLSPLHLNDDDFKLDVRQWLGTMPAGRFTYMFEVTERIMVGGDHMVALFDWLHQQGIEIAIDDFGTGHSALIYLAKFHFDYLKIDRGFVQSIGHETVTSPVLDAVLNLAKKLRLHTVAEGVETADQASWLVAHGVTYLQGYYYARPMSPTALAEWLARQPAKDVSNGKSH